MYRFAVLAVYAFRHVCIFFDFLMMLVDDFFYMFLSTGIDKLKRKVDTSMSQLYCDTVHKGNTENTIFSLKKCFLFVCVYWIVFNVKCFFGATCVRFDFVKSPEVTLCG